MSYLVPVLLGATALLAALGAVPVIRRVRKNGKRIKGHGVTGPVARTPRKRYRLSELTDLSRDDIDGRKWEQLMRAVHGEDADMGDVPSAYDPHIAESPRTPQQGEESR